MRIIVYLTSHHRIVSHTLLILSQMERYVYFAEKLIRISIASDTAHNKIYIYIYISFQSCCIETNLCFQKDTTIKEISYET
jgi:hypothetical protein